MGPYTLIPGKPKRLLTAATTGNGAIFVPDGAIARATIVLQSTGTTSGGAVSIEECYFDNIGTVDGIEYAGTWSVIQSVSASTFTGGAQVVVHVLGSVWALRCRISSTITGGGTVDAWVYGN